MPTIDLDVLGTSGLKQFNGIVNEEFLHNLKHRKGVQAYREMIDNSAVVGAVRFMIRAMVRQVEWRVEPASDENEAVEAAAFVESCLEDMEMTFEDFIGEVLSFLDFGWAYFETIYKVRKGETDDPTTISRYEDGKYGWRKFGLRPQDTLERWEIDRYEGEVHGMHQVDWYTGRRAYIPLERAVNFRTETHKNNPEGRSIFRNAIIYYYFLKRICEIEAIGIERDLAGLPVMEVPLEILAPNPTTDALAVREYLKRLLSLIKRGEHDYALIPSSTDTKGQPSGFNFRLMSSGGSRQINTTEVKLFYKRSILQTVLAQFLELGMTDTGSRALVSGQANIFSVAMGAYMDSMAATFSRDAIGRLMAANGIHAHHWPTLHHGDIESPPLNEMGAYIQSLFSVGMLPEDDAIRRTLLEYAGLPIPSEYTVEDVSMLKSRDAGGFKTKYLNCGCGKYKPTGRAPLRIPG